MLKTPSYSYNLSLLEATLNEVMMEAKRYDFIIHYAIKANNNAPILKCVREHGLGVDCVSGNEVRCALEVGFDASLVVFAGVGKSDEEIIYAIEQDIFSLNCESKQELEVVDGLARSLGKKVRVALRVNPNVDPRTHKFISTGNSHSKFGISLFELEEIINSEYKNLNIEGIHFHIGSQITDYTVFEELCRKVNIVIRWFADRGMTFQHINVGGGLGIDYEKPEKHPIANFQRYFDIFNKGVIRGDNQKIHFELGRSLVGQCGELLTKVLYNKVSGSGDNIVVVDAGMNNLMRPALYGAHHKIVNLSSTLQPKTYNIVGPICESTDIFSEGIVLPETRRGDILSIKSVGAYGESMSSQYNMRDIADANYI